MLTKARASMNANLDQLFFLLISSLKGLSFGSKDCTKELKTVEKSLISSISGLEPG